MALNIVTAAQPMRVENLIVFIYGDPGIGKTSLAFSASNPILFDFDRGAHRAGKFRKDTVPVSCWADVATINAEDLQGYDTIIIDTAGRMLDVIINDLVKDQKNCRKNSKELSIQGYGALNKRFSSWLNLIRSFGKDVILLAHATEDKKGDELIIRPDMVGGSKKEAYKVADMMGYMTTIQGDQGVETSLNFSPSTSHHAKDSGAIGNITLAGLETNSAALADIIEQAKSHINNLSEAQATAMQELEIYRNECMAAQDAHDLNDLRKQLDSNPLYLKEMRQALDLAFKSMGDQVAFEHDAFIQLEPPSDHTEHEEAA
ncbi:ATP-binding protein [Alkanindiges sp. WGS2144]|uniref:ATP-binding protein n=1 Tax=Alkanindiges sp. WGS2144 TaxID=3366808 RepID=UPI0037500E88